MNQIVSRFINLKNRQRFILITLLFALAVMIRALSAGTEYLPILDDSIQYITYPSVSDYFALIKVQGLFSSRPLAAIIDLFVIGQMNECLLIPVLLLSALHGVAGVLFLRLFDKIWGTGTAFAVFYALLPLGVEGTYWLSASSRIVTGLFFAAVAANLLEDFIDSGKWRYLAAFPIAALLSYGFYEQILVVSFTLSMLQFLRCVRASRRAWGAMLVFPMLAAYFVFTSLNTVDGVLSSRIQIAVPIGNWYYDTFLPDVIGQIGAAFIKGGTRTLFVGFARGLKFCIDSFGGIIYLAASLAVGAAIYFLTSHRAKTKLQKQRFGVYIWGILLFFAPITPFLIIGNPWFSLRATVPSFIGAGLLVDAILQLILRRERLYAIFCALIAAVCMIAGASEVNDYHDVGEYDNVLAAAILESADEMSGRVGFLCVEEIPIKGQNYAYHEHVASVGGSDWALYGKLTAVDPKWGGFYPVPLGVDGFSFYKGWNQSIKRISGFDEIWLWDDDTVSLTKMQALKLDTGEHDYEIRFEDGTPWGRVFEEDVYGYIEIYE